LQAGKTKLPKMAHKTNKKNKIAKKPNKNLTRKKNQPKIDKKF